MPLRGRFQFLPRDGSSEQSRAVPRLSALVAPGEWHVPTPGLGCRGAQGPGRAARGGRRGQQGCSRSRDERSHRQHRSGYFYSPPLGGLALPMTVKSLACLRRAAGMAPSPSPRCRRRCRHSAQHLQPHHPRDTPFLLKREQEETEASHRDHAQSCTPRHPPKACDVPRTSRRGGAAGSGRRRSEQEHRQGSGWPIAWPPLRRCFCLSTFNFADEKKQQTSPKELWGGGNA